MTTEERRDWEYVTHQVDEALRLAAYWADKAVELRPENEYEPAVYHTVDGLDREYQRRTYHAVGMKSLRSRIKAMRHELSKIED
jgi:hypothetical protein